MATAECLRMTKSSRAQGQRAHLGELRRGATQWHLQHLKRPLKGWMSCRGAALGAATVLSKVHFSSLLGPRSC
eukprot:12793306-Alexandrium_andersonii.AAC.1